DRNTGDLGDTLKQVVLLCLDRDVDEGPRFLHPERPEAVHRTEDDVAGQMPQDVGDRHLVNGVGGGCLGPGPVWDVDEVTVTEVLETRPVEERQVAAEVMM